MSAKQCTGCGKDNALDAKFCNYCGVKVIAEQNATNIQVGDSPLDSNRENHSVEAQKNAQMPNLSQIREPQEDVTNSAASLGEDTSNRGEGSKQPEPSKREKNADSTAADSSYSRPRGIGKSLIKDSGKQNSRAKFCMNCGEDLYGQVICGCGWRIPSSSRRKPLIFLVSAAALIGGTFLLVTSWYQIFPDNNMADDQFRRGNDEYLHGSFDAAVSDYENAARLSPRRADIRYRYAWGLFQQSKPSEAVKQMTIAVQLNPHDEKAQIQLGDMLRSDQQLEPAAEQFKEASGLFPKFAHECMVKEGACLQGLGKWDKAYNLFKQCTASFPSDEVSWTQSVECLINMGKKEEALRTLTTALHHVPHSAFLHFKRGYLMSDGKDKQEAITELRMSAELDPSTNEYIANMINQLSTNGSIQSYFVPLEKRGDSMLTEAVLNERVRVKLVVDSGAEVCTIPKAIAQDLGIDLSKCAKAEVASVTGTDEAFVATLDSVKLGAAVAKNVTVYVYNLSSDKEADGLLGMSFLNHFRFSIDSDRRTLSLSPKGLSPISQTSRLKHRHK